jgi:hypothetical protein
MSMANATAAIITKNAVRACNPIHVPISVVDEELNSSSLRGNKNELSCSSVRRWLLANSDEANASVSGSLNIVNMSTSITKQLTSHTHLVGYPKDVDLRVDRIQD